MNRFTDRIYAGYIELVRWDSVNKKETERDGALSVGFKRDNIIECTQSCLRFYELHDDSGNLEAKGTNYLVWDEQTKEVTIEYRKLRVSNLLFVGT